MRYLYIMRPILIILFFMLISVSAKSQKWQPGYFYDANGQKVPGLIKPNPSGKGPVKDEGFLVYKDNENALEVKLSAREIRAYVVGQDSFVIAHPPRDAKWAKKDLDFVRVVLDEPLKLYQAKGSGGGGLGIRPGFSGGFGMGGGSYGGVGISLGGGQGRSKTAYYYGANTSELNELNNDNFIDIMSEIMGDEPEVVEKIRNKQYQLKNLDTLVAYFKHIKALRTNN
jgi:hypothetical protein